MISLCTKFDISSFSHSWDIDEAPKTLNKLHDVTMQLSGTFCCP